MNDRPCLICRETIIPETDETLCHACGDKLADVARLSRACAQFSRENSSTSLRDNPHFMPAERAQSRLIGKQNWGCSRCHTLMPNVNENSKSACCDAPIFLD